MESRSLNFIAAACGGAVVQGPPETVIDRVCTDSRELRAGDLFWALKGERFDGHDFLQDAQKKGVAGVLVAREHLSGTGLKCPVVAVASPRAALGAFAAAYRKDFSLPVIAVGGSNGKTTTKDLIASVVKQRLATLSSEASFNNEIGVPVTLLRLDKGHQAAVLETGTNHPGELTPLVEMVRPNLGVVTSIGREHLEFFQDLAGVAREEGALAQALPAAGKLFLNGDSEWAAVIAARTAATVVRIGLGAENDWRVRNVRLDTHGVSFRVDAPVALVTGDYRIHLLGRHQVVNAMFAIAVGAELGLNRGEIERGLAACLPAKMRLQLSEIGGVRVLDDAYNANSDSMLAALQTMKDLPCKGRRVVVLGDMAEVGLQSEAAHEEVGRCTAELGMGQLFAVGRMAGAMARGARQAGLNRVFEFSEVGLAAAAVKGFVKEGDLLLLKASRATRLEQITEVLRAAEGRKN